MNLALIDIDNTLWNFADALYERLAKVNPDVPLPDYWTHWDFWKPYFKPETFYSIVNEIHAEQDRYGVYPDAEEFLENLYVHGYKIIIASHRSQESREATLKWLYKHKLIFHDLHLSYDKTVLFNKCCMVIDDAPHILEKAISQNLIATGLEFAWNRGNGFKLFKSLNEINEFLVTMKLSNNREKLNLQGAKT